ncbi:hypothetical protein [Candidatus Magnetobacterium casense]|uniref:Large polyvalent protein associated domain-containing protein n=1 Tax=Candidatus Magnetobacterium casense TaxID=1455061 RepID=A0ABS6RWT0_9BACT|nr:hypothetical protein [Candidatus Magnetobacterium casensis]MBV6341082.1 hypothetical protein [Candidatus Magnetobacterium casensis]
MPVTNLNDYMKLRSSVLPDEDEAEKDRRERLMQQARLQEPGTLSETASGLSAALRGLVSGMTLGGSDKFLKAVFGKEAVEKREGELAPHTGVRKAGEFAGNIVPVSTSLKVAAAVPWVAKLPKVVRAAVTNTLAGAGLGALEQKGKDESRIEKIGKEAATFGAIGAGTAGLAPAVGAIAKSKVPVFNKVAGWFVRKPLPKGFQPRLREFYGETATKRAEAREVGAELGALSKGKQIRAKQVIAGGITTPATPPEVIELVDKPITRFAEATKTFQEGGALGKPYYQKLTKAELADMKAKKLSLEKQFDKLQHDTRHIPSDSPAFSKSQEMLDNIETSISDIDKRIYIHYHEGGSQYFPRMYASKEQQGALSKWGFFKPFRFRGKRTYLKAREDIPEEVRKNMGEIMTAAYPVQRRLGQLSYDTSVFNLFDDVAQNPEWSTTSAEIAQQKGWVKLTKTPTWGLGALRKSYVQPDVAEVLNSMSEIRSGFEKSYDKFLGAWKYSKVIPRPSTWARNIFNNFVFADLANVNPKVIPSVVKDYVSNGSMRRELVRVGLLGAEYLPTEASAVMDVVKKPGGNIFDWTADTMKRGVSGLGKFYTAQDQIFKQWIYASELAGGASKEKALDAAFRWMPNYREVPKATQVLRKSPFGAPFASFTSEALRIAGEAAREQPLKFAKWLSLPLVMNEVSKRKLEISEEEWKEVKQTFPDYMHNGLHVLLPMGSKNKFRVLDLTYMMFYGDAIEYGLKPSVKLMSNPVVTAASEAITGIDTFTGKPIVKHVKPTVKEKVQDWTDYLYRDFMPALAPEIPKTGIKGGFDYVKIKDTITGKPHPFTGKPPSAGETIAGTVFGLKTKEMRPEELKTSYLSRKSGEISELEKELFRVALDKSLTEKERQAKTENIKAKILQIQKEITP